MIIRFTPSNIAYLNTLKEAGQHRDKRIHINVLFNVFAEACKIKKLRCFKTAWFNQGWTGTHHSGGSHSDMQLVLGRGQILNCVKYGNKEGLIEKVSSYRWEFIDNNNKLLIQ